ncbi:MAG: class I SAM-dependent methyltransferase [Acetobacteraceae bacterium]
MGQTRDRLLRDLWGGRDPFAGFPRNLYEVDLQGWGFQHPWLTETVAALRPQHVLEVGVWKGASVVRMAGALRDLGIDGAVIAVDTWLGSAEHWLHGLEELGMENGRPALQKKFMNNILAEDLADHVVPLPLDSLNAAHVLGARGIGLDMIHLDGGHDYAIVMADLHAWWPLVRPGGALIGDDYYVTGDWPGVKQAFDEYFAVHAPGLLEFGGSKCRIRKPPS